MVMMFLFILACGVMCVCLHLVHESPRVKSTILGRWSLGLQLTNLNKGFSTKKAPRFFLLPLFFFNNFELGVLFVLTNFETYI
jgi:hypothetical protein